MGYVFKEKEIPGTFNEERAEELGIPPSPLRGKLKKGKSIVLANGRRIDPEEVVGPPRKGRKVVYTSDTRPTEHTISNSEGASLLIHDGAFLSEHLEQAKKKFHSTIKEAVTIAKRAKVNTLALVHFS
ncbi:MAG: ribonuclease Z, partial [Nitrosopumilaceae archaeon]|nr:ribonuclease Z [Nitrosopumilaceae archaeon]NIU87710.1 ribonuclease Z [Nitrosopumilaceae archaeon]NIV66106.1 ribonuclease Z [Nitrosopumilaceae archaeon]NIX61966.1 ribonuclease Z [Nitrosopumilaceae archaeon]